MRWGYDSLKGNAKGESSPVVWSIGSSEVMATSPVKKSGLWFVRLQEAPKQQEVEFGLKFCFYLVPSSFFINKIQHTFIDAPQPLTKTSSR